MYMYMQHWKLFQRQTVIVVPEFILPVERSDPLSPLPVFLLIRPGHAMFLQNKQQVIHKETFVTFLYADDVCIVAYRDKRK